MSFHVDDDIKLFEKYKTIWNKIESLQNIKFNAFPIYEDKYIKIKIGTYREQFYINSTAEMCQRMVWNVSLLQPFLLLLNLFMVTNFTSTYI